jgi:hypothetical protein
LDYKTTLEKAVLEYAADGRHPEKRQNLYARIPGFPDPHVWGMATALADKGHLVAGAPGEKGDVSVSEITEEGAERLQALVAERQQIDDGKRLQQEKAAARAREKAPWWRRKAG